MEPVNLLRRMIESILIILLLVWLLLSLLIYLFQANYVYYPRKTLDLTPDAVGLDYEDVYLTSSDGIKLHGWYLPRTNSRGTLLFLHGNAGNISHRTESLRLFHDLGFSVFIIDYRGYGLSKGSPSENGTYRDAEAAWLYLTEEKSIPAKQIIIFGRSLGGSVAAWLATQHTPAGLIIESTFSSTVDMGKHIYPFLPITFITRIKYPTVDRMPDIHCPVLVVHSSEDDIVPYEQGRKLYAAANEPRYFLEIQGDHNQGFLQSGNAYMNGLRKFLDKYMPMTDHHESSLTD